MICVCLSVCLCVCQLDKAYDPDAPEDDMVERYEEMNVVVVVIVVVVVP